MPPKKQTNTKTVVLIPDTGTTGPRVTAGPPWDTEIANSYPTGHRAKVKLPPAAYEPLAKGRERVAMGQGFQVPQTW